MAEAEVQKHTKKILSIMGDGQSTFWKKGKEFLIEIFTIVFAITLSIWLHDKSEQSHQQKEVTEFLIGLREDLISDQKELTEDRKLYIKQQRFYAYVSSIKPIEKPNSDSLKKYINEIFSSVKLLQNNGRFEGFKASGKIGNIKNTKLQNDIMDLYQESIPSLLSSTDFYLNKKNQLIQMVEKNIFWNKDNSIVIDAAFQSNESRIICLQLASISSEIITRYDGCMKKSKDIVELIENTSNVNEETEH